jgi:hypothetical protein
MLPLETGVLEPSFLSDPNYIGDVPPTAYVNDGIWGINNGSGPYWTGTEYHTPWMQELEQADALYITPGLLALSQIYNDEATASINAYVSFTSYFIPVFASVFVLVMLVWFLPETIRENKAMQAKRSMLLYLPPIVITRYSFIRAAIDNIVSTDSADTFSGAAVNKKKVTPI